MTWFKVDDSLAFHPKVLAAGNTAMGLWVRAGSWASQLLTDGVVPEMMLSAFGASVDDADALVAAGLWERCEGGWRFHGWEERQPSKAQVTERRQRSAERVAKWRANNPKRDTPSSNAVTNRVTNGVTNGVGNAATNAAPDPTRPVSIETYVPTSPSVGGAGGDTSQQAAPRATKPRADRGTRIPDGWVPSEKTRDDLRQQYPGLPDQWWRLEHEKFTNHFRAATGRNARKVDWDLTFRNWVHEGARRTGATRLVNGVPSVTPPQPTSTAQERVQQAQALKRGRPTEPGQPQLAIAGGPDGMG